MARQGNTFALLDDEEGDDVTTLLAHVAAKVEASPPVVVEKKKKPHPKSQQPPAAPPAAEAAKFPAKALSPLDSVRSERGRGRGGHGRGSGRFGSGGNDGSDGYQRNFGGSDGYQRNFGGSDGYQRNYGGSGGYQQNDGGSDGYQRNYGGGNGYQRNSGGANDYQGNYGGNSAGNVDDNWQGRGRGRGGGRGRGRGRGRGFNEDNGFGSESHVVVDNQELKNQGQDGDGGWEEVTEPQGKVYGSESRSTRDERSFRNGNRGSGGERRGYGGGNRGFRGRDGRSFSGRDERDGGDYGSGEVLINFETKEDPGGDMGHAVNGDNKSGSAEWDVPVTIEILKDAEPEQGELEQVVTQDNSEKKAQEEENNQMTLEEYEKLLLEKRKALEALKKTEERKVTIDKDFESMQLVKKKKEDSLVIKLVNSEKDKLKKKESLEKEEKVRKSVSINEFLKPAEGGNYTRSTVARGRGGRGRGRGDRGGFRGGFSGQSGLVKAAPELRIQDPGQFPDLGEAVKG